MATDRSGLIAIMARLKRPETLPSVPADEALDARSDSLVERHAIAGQTDRTTLRAFMDRMHRDRLAKL